MSAELVMTLCLTSFVLAFIVFSFIPPQVKERDDKTPG